MNFIFKTVRNLIVKSDNAIYLIKLILRISFRLNCHFMNKVIKLSSPHYLRFKFESSSVASC